MSDDWTQSEDPTLLPCPFCGAPAMVVKSTNTNWYGHWLVACNADDDACPVDPYLFGGDKPEHKQKAIERWNRRA
jgi:Lar family restriction alleviation protein